MKFQVFGCPNCQQPFQVAEAQAGQLVQCPCCAQTVEIPADVFAEIERPPVEQQVYACPNCNGQFGVTSDMFGQQVGCPHCQTSILVQVQDAPPENASAFEIVTDDSMSDKRKKTSKRWKSPAKPDDEKDLFAPGFEKPKRETDPQTQRANRREEPKTVSGDLTPPSKPKLASGKRTAADANPPTQKFRAKSRTIKRSEDFAPPRDSQTKQPDETKQPDSIDHLLPPRFDVLDPTRMRQNLGKDQFKVFLPDGKGGTKQVDQRLVRVEHEGEQVSLVAMTEKEKRRRRLIQNVVAIVIGIIIMAIAFQLLR